jgi:hypothetical protein
MAGRGQHARNAKVVQPPGNLQLSQLPAHDVFDALEPPDLLSFRQGFRASCGI